jgi:hypothetical protein
LKGRQRPFFLTEILRNKYSVIQEPTITCYTLFDIPDRGNRSMIRNWNTVVQTLSLRTQPIIINFPTVIQNNIKKYNFGKSYNNLDLVDIWSFTFTAEKLMLYSKDEDPIGLLLDDANMIPMIDHNNIIIPPKCLSTQGDLCNIYFAYNN